MGGTVTLPRKSEWAPHYQKWTMGALRDCFERYCTMLDEKREALTTFSRRDREAAQRAQPLTAVNRREFFELFTAPATDDFVSLPLEHFQLMASRGGKAPFVEARRVMLAICLFCTGAPDAKFVFVFHLFDSHRKGVWDKDDFADCFATLSRVLSNLGIKHREPTVQDIQYLADVSFAEADAVRKNSVTSHDFGAWVRARMSLGGITRFWQQANDRQKSEAERLREKKALVLAARRAADLKAAEDAIAKASTSANGADSPTAAEAAAAMSPVSTTMVDVPAEGTPLSKDDPLTPNDAQSSVGMLSSGVTPTASALLGEGSGGRAVALRAVVGKTAQDSDLPPGMSMSPIAALEAKRGSRSTLPLEDSEPDSPVGGFRRDGANDRGSFMVAKGDAPLLSPVPGKARANVGMSPVGEAALLNEGVPGLGPGTSPLAAMRSSPVNVAGSDRHNGPAADSPMSGGSPKPVTGQGRVAHGGWQAFLGVATAKVSFLHSTASAAHSEAHKTASKSGTSSHRSDSSSADGDAKRRATGRGSNGKGGKGKDAVNKGKAKGHQRDGEAKHEGGLDLTDPRAAREARRRNRNRGEAYEAQQLELADRLEEAAVLAKRQETHNMKVGSIGSKVQLKRLAAETKFDLDELRVLANGFAEYSDVTCKMTRSTFFHILGRFVPRLAQGFAGQLFITADHDHDGKLEFREFVRIMSFVSRGTVSEKLGEVFKLIDDDNDGQISNFAVVNFLRVATENFALTRMIDTTESLIKMLDENSDGEIERHEFVAALSDNQKAFAMFSRCIELNSNMQRAIMNLRDACPGFTFENLNSDWSDEFRQELYKPLTEKRFRKFCEKRFGVSRHDDRIVPLVDDVFASFDTRGTGSCAYRSCLNGCGQVLAPSKSAKINFFFDIYDADGNGSLDDNELLWMIMSSQETQSDSVMVVKRLDALDPDNDGFINKVDFMRVAAHDKLFLRSIDTLFRVNCPVVEVFGEDVIASAAQANRAGDSLWGAGRVKSKLQSLANDARGKAISAKQRRLNQIQAVQEAQAKAREEAAQSKLAVDKPSPLGVVMGAKGAYDVAERYKKAKKAVLAMRAPPISALDKRLGLTETEVANPTWLGKLREGDDEANGVFSGQFSPRRAAGDVDGSDSGSDAGDGGSRQHDNPAADEAHRPSPSRVEELRGEITRQSGMVRAKSDTEILKSRSRRTDGSHRDDRSASPTKIGGSARIADSSPQSVGSIASVLSRAREETSPDASPLGAAPGGISPENRTGKAGARVLWDVLRSDVRSDRDKAFNTIRAGGLRAIAGSFRSARALGKEAVKVAPKEGVADVVRESKFVKVGIGKAGPAPGPGRVTGTGGSPTPKPLAAAAGMRQLELRMRAARENTLKMVTHFREELHDLEQVKGPVVPSRKSDLHKPMTPMKKKPKHAVKAESKQQRTHDRGGGQRTGKNRGVEFAVDAEGGGNAKAAAKGDKAGTTELPDGVEVADNIAIWMLGGGGELKAVERELKRRERKRVKRERRELRGKLGYRPPPDDVYDVDKIREGRGARLSGEDSRAAARHYGF